MNEAVHGAMRRAARRMGFDVRRHHPTTSSDARRQRILDRHAVDLVLDVGANRGQYARELRIAGYGGRVLSFEPVPGAYARLSAQCARDPAWECQRLALGTETGRSVMQVASNEMMSSSLLAMGQGHRDTDPSIRIVDEVTVNVETLDAVMTRLEPGPARPWLKLDVQGAELQVLDGAPRSLERFVALEMELSLVTLYEAQPLFPELWSFVTKHGFRCVGLEPAFVNAESGEVVQLNGIFLRDRRGVVNAAG